MQLLRTGSALIDRFFVLAVCGTSRKLEWSLEKKALFDNSRTVSSIRYIETGWASNGLIHAAQQSSKKIKCKISGEYIPLPKILLPVVCIDRLVSSLYCWKIPHSS